MSAVLLDPLLTRHTLSVIVGAPFAGKTMLSMQLFASLQDPCPNFFGLAGLPDLKLAMLTADQPVGDYRETAIDAGLDLDQVQWFSQQRDASATDQRMFNAKDKDEGFEYFLQTMDQLYLQHGIDLFLVEPLGSWLKCNILDPAKVSHRLGELTSWLSTRHCAILGSFHQGKAVYSKQFFRPIDRVYAAPALLGHCSSVLILDLTQEIQKNPTNPYGARLTVQQRHGAPQHIWLDRDKTSNRWVLSASGKALKAGATTRQGDLLAFIQARGGSVLRGDLKRDWLTAQTVHSEKSMNRDLIALAGLGMIVNDNPGGMPTAPYRVPAVVQVPDTLAVGATL
jgi:AAA domain-containing protein